MVEKLRLSAHRGAHTVAPENTLEAFQEAIKMGYRAIELDPRFSSDGEIFIMHDDTVDRMTNGTGAISEMTSSQIKDLDIDVTDYPKYEHQILRVPTFEESVKLISTGNVILNVDGSKVDWSNGIFTKKIVNILKQYGMYEKTYFVISNASQRAAFNLLYPDAILSWLHTDANTLASAITTAKSYQRSILSIPLNIATDAVLTVLRNTNIYYQVYSVSNENDLNRLISKKVPMIETDGMLS